MATNKENTNTFASITISKGNTTLNGYVLTDGTFDFLIDGKMRNYKTILDVWAAWTDLH